MEVGAVPGAEEPQADGGKGHGPRHPQGLEGAPADAAAVPGAEILGGEAGHGGAETVEGRHQQVIELGGRAEAVLGRGADHGAVLHVELHHHALHHDDAHGQHGELQPQGHALDQVPRHLVPGEAPVGLRQPQLGIAAEGVEEAAHGADELGRHGGEGRPGHAPAEAQDEKEVQPHVQDRGEEEEGQGRGGIPHAPQEGADEVIEELGSDAREDHRAVGVGRPVDLAALGGDVDPGQHGIEKGQGQGRQQHRQDAGEQELHGERPADAGVVMGAHPAGGDGAEARADAEGELQEDEDQGGGVVDPGHLLGRQGLAHDGGVADGIDLLEKVGEDDGAGKGQNGPPAGPVDQVHGAEERPQAALLPGRSGRTAVENGGEIQGSFHGQMPRCRLGFSGEEIVFLPRLGDDSPTRPESQALCGKFKKLVLPCEISPNRKLSYRHFKQ